MSKPIDGVGLAAVGIGSVLMWAGIKGYSVLAVLQNLVTGKPIATGVSQTNVLTNQLPGTQSMGSAPAPSGGNRGLGQSLAATYGWSGAEWTALETLWTHESNWDNHAKNPSSGAYGIPQALPHTKMAKAAWPESAGGSSDANAQILWGLSYIRSRYGSPTMAWAFWQANNWY